MSEVQSKLSEWSQRTDTRTGDKAHGITFVMFERQLENTRGEAAISSRKANLDGKVALTLALNQTQYGDELIAQVYSNNPKDIRVGERQADNYNRIQVYLGPADLDTVQMLTALIQEIISRLKND